MTETTPSRLYCLVSPVRDEAEFMRRTLDSVVSQTVPPAKWVIVDDGSTDDTPQVLADYAARHPFITIVQRDHRHGRRVGGGVVEAFYVGLDTIDQADYAYLGKLDMDLDLPPRYFEGLIEMMEADPRIGTVSGKAYFPGPANRDKSFAGDLISEQIGDDVSLGMTKFWRTACFRDIGGLVRGVLWDGIDCYKARMTGWKAFSTDREDLRFLHLRPMGSSDRGIITGRQRWGRGHWFMGSSPVFVLATALNRARFRPRIVGGLAMLTGYVKAMIERQERLNEPEFRRYLRRYQWAMLRLGKARALRRFDELGAEPWNRKYGAS